MERSFDAHMLTDITVDNPEPGACLNVECEVNRGPCTDLHADIAGANAAGWPSVLVKTGVYEPARGPPTHEPTYIAEDVEEAVRWAIHREMGRK